MSPISTPPKPLPPRLSGCDFFLSLAQLVEGVTFRREPEFKYPAPQRNVEPFIALAFRSVDCVIVSFRINSTHRGRFVASYAHHGRYPIGDIVLCRCNHTVHVSEEIVVIPLQLLMQAGVTPKIERQLCSTDPRDCGSDNIWRDTPPSERIRDSRRAEQHHEEIEPTVPFLKVATHRRVVERVTQDVKADILEVHVGIYFPGLGALGLGDTGWRGPTPAPAPPWFDGADAGWRGPKVLCSYSAILITPLWSFARWGVGADSRSPANRHRYYNRWSRTKSRQRVSGGMSSSPLITSSDHSSEGVSRNV